MSVKRIAISLEPELLAKLEKTMKGRVYANRSKAVSDSLRSWFSLQEWNAGSGPKVATISIVYSHHTHGVLERITDVQHDFGGNVLATLHIHLTHDDCLEVIAAKGTPKKIRALAAAIESVRGVKSCKLAIVN